LMSYFKTRYKITMISLRRWQINCRWLGTPLRFRSPWM